MPEGIGYPPENRNIWQTDFLEDNPAFAYGAFQPQRGVNFAGAPRSFFDYYQNRRLPIEREFVAEQGRRAAAGLPPSGSNVDFLGNYPWMSRWLQLTPEQRGVGYAPQFRWNIPR
jgi:hypothetical protein